jgi:chemotaxis protein MotB
MKKYTILLSAIIFTFAACVPKKELISSQNRVKALQKDSIGTHSSLNDCNAQVATLENDKANLKKSIDELSASYSSAQANSNANLANSQMTIAEQAKRLKDMEGIIQQEKDVMNKLKKTIADALINFKPDELTVTLKDGKLYVALQEKLLFESGSAEVFPKGKEALKTLSSVLTTTSGITVDVEGQTDSVPITGKYQDNWALSTARATSVVRILVNDYNVDPHMVIASGRSKYLPVATNSTKEGRASNRRTDIILSPDLTELFKLLN